jgi:hypothetical protein
MRFLSQYSSFVSQLFDGHLLGKDSLELSHSRPEQREERSPVRNLAGLLVDILLGMCDSRPLYSLVGRGLM